MTTAVGSATFSGWFLYLNLKADSWKFGNIIQHEPLKGNSNDSCPCGQDNLPFGCGMWGAFRSVSQLWDPTGKDEDMICVWQVFGDIQNFTYIAEIATIYLYYCVSIYIVSSHIQVAHQALAHRLFISPWIKGGQRLRGFGKGRDQTFIIMSFARTNWVIERQSFPRVHNHRWKESEEW